MVSEKFESPLDWVSAGRILKPLDRSDPLLPYGDNTNQLYIHNSNEDQNLAFSKNVIQPQTHHVYI